MISSYGVSIAKKNRPNPLKPAGSGRSVEQKAAAADTAAPGNAAAAGDRREIFVSFEESLRLTLDEVVPVRGVDDGSLKTLGNIAVLIGNKFEADVCSIYVLDPDQVELVLRATVGLRQDSIGHVRMRVDEGLVGLVAEQLCPIAVEEATTHPRFKYFPQAGEDPYHSFLGVPAVDEGLLQGVLTIQTTEPRTFSALETSRLVSAARQLGAILTRIRAAMR